MTTTESPTAAIIPAWVVPPHYSHVKELHHLTYSICEAGCDTYSIRGMLAAVDWVTGGQAAPVTQREDPVTRDVVRAESWVALCMAAGAPAPSPQDWARLGVVERPAVTGNPEWGYGVWRTLSWLLGVRRDPPTELRARDEDGVLTEYQDRYMFRVDRDAPDPARRARELAEARRWWEYTRARIDQLTE